MWLRPRDRGAPAIAHQGPRQDQGVQGSWLSEKISIRKKRIIFISYLLVWFIINPVGSKANESLQLFITPFWGDEMVEWSDFLQDDKCCPRIESTIHLLLLNKMMLPFCNRLNNEKWLFYILSFVCRFENINHSICSLLLSVWQVWRRVYWQKLAKQLQSTHAVSRRTWNRLNLVIKGIDRKIDR